MNTLIKRCLVCRRTFKKSYTRSLNHWKKAKFCSFKCFHSQHKPWLGIKRPQMTEWLKNAYRTGKKKKVIILGSKNQAWKGDGAGYHAMHKWLETKFGKPSKCELCKTTKKRKYEWANKDHTYKRKREDYMRLCTPCHRRWDIQNNSY